MDAFLLIQFIILGALIGYSAIRNWQHIAVVGTNLSYGQVLKEQLGDLIPALGVVLLVVYAASAPNGLNLTMAWVAACAYYGYRLPGIR